MTPAAGSLRWPEARPGQPALEPVDDEVAFPLLGETELAEVRRFGKPQSFNAGEPLFTAGQEPFDSYVILAGTVRVIDVSTGERVVFVRYGAGRFTGDIDLLTRRPSVVSCEAETDVETIRLTLAELRLMFTQEPQLGEKFWKSFQRRRELLLVSPFRGLTIYGPRDDKATLELVELLFRNGVPHEWADSSLAEQRRELNRMLDGSASYPVVARGSRVLFQAPTREQLADHLRLRRRVPAVVYDVLILGAGPAGLGAAVYAASEGLSTLVLDSLGPGGQAGSTSRIENYAGFPDGISGRDLSQLVYLQALKFGADFHVPSTVCHLERERDGLYRVTTAGSEEIRGRGVIVATGVSYASLALEGLSTLEGPGVYYSATQVEARACRDSPVHVVGGGNSAGQAAMFLSESASEVSLLIRGRDMRRMSSYLAERLIANEKVKIRFGVEAAGVRGVERIRSVVVRESSGELKEEPTAGLFVFIGARPRTEFLSNSVARDAGGYLLTGPEVALLDGRTQARLPCANETSLPGVFAAGDCRQGAATRVASAIGDGAGAVGAVHSFLEQGLSSPLEERCAS